MSESLISHALNGSRLKLKEHILQVIKVSKYLVAQKHLNFNGLKNSEIEELCVLVAACHDFGKSSAFFQDYILSVLGGVEYAGNERDKSHSLISGLFGWYMTTQWLDTKQHIEDRWKRFLPFAVLAAIEGHHGSYGSMDEILNTINVSDDSGLLTRQFQNIKPEIFTYEFGAIALQDGRGFDLSTVGGIKKQLRSLQRSYPRTSLDYQLEQRILGLFLYSVLLESDKAYLASDSPEQYEREPISIPDDVVDKYLKRLDSRAAINERRKKAYDSTIKDVNRFSLLEKIHSITLPTGMGKTLLALSWATKLRSRLQKEGISQKIIVSLPYLSIIEQTDNVYKDVLGNLYKERLDRLYTNCYSIADFEYKDGIDKAERSDNSVDFYLSIWNSEIIVTTFDQLLYCPFSLKSKHLMRFHNLFNAILVFDEIQALPSNLWKPFEYFFRKLSEIGNTHILLMSATQPGFISDAIERVPEHKNYFIKDNSRVEVSIDLAPMQLERFIQSLLAKLDGLHDKAVMVVLNTRPSSKKVYEDIKRAINEGLIKKRPMVYLSSNVTPAQRIKRLRRIKRYIERCRNPLIISTQCIEAGVDIDVDYIIRDWAPLDSIFQVCGRCNRNGAKSAGKVEIVHLLSENGKAFAGQVYDDRLLESTAFSLNNSVSLQEDEFYNYGTRYFEQVKERLGHSMKVVKAYADYSHKYVDNGAEVDVNIKKLLRGDEWQEQFVVSSLDTALQQDIRTALEIDDRWKRRYALKRLGKRISENSINIRFENWMSARPNDFADYSIGNFWIMDEQFYDKDGVGFTGNVYKQVGGLKIT